MPQAEEQSLQSVSSANRIEALDVARGLALFGILMVNVQLLAQPLSWLIKERGGATEGPIGVATYYLTRLFFESKSYPLFSMLFGMGLMLMRDRALAAGRSFTRPYLRRLSMLLAMGVAHALLLYSADVLVIYAIIGFFVMWLAGRSSKRLLRLALIMLTLTVLWNVVGVVMVATYLGSKGGPGVDGDSPVIAETTGDAIESPFLHLMEMLNRGDLPATGPMNPEWTHAALDAYQNGPLSNAITMRGLDWIAEQFNWTIGGGAALQIAGMFLLGAWLMRVGAISAKGNVWIRRFLLIGLLVGLPASVAGVALQSMSAELSIWIPLGQVFTSIASPCFSLAYMGIAMWLSRRHMTSWPVRSIASTGRMALTNYIMQSFLVCLIAQHWGFAMFGKITQAQMLGIVLSIYAFQVVVSPIWLRRFTMGPLEWSWRWWTYLRRPRLLNRP
jgi:uncharacterized protein